MFPNADHLPSRFPQASRLPFVALLVLREFRSPVILVRLRECRMLRTSMPETSIDEHSDFRAEENDIDRDAFDAMMQSVPQPSRVVRRTESAFRFRILVLHPTHDLGTRRRLSALPVRLPLVGSVSVQSGHLFRIAIECGEPFLSSSSASPPSRRCAERCSSRWLVPNRRARRFLSNGQRA